MTEYLQVYTERGRLSYVPENIYQLPSTPTGFFQPRNPRPHRIHIAHVGPDFSFCRQRTRSKPSLIIDKLAGPRENAKRFLRSFIASHTSADRQPEQTSPRSSIASSSRSGALSSDDRRGSLTESMRTNSRDMVGGPVSGVAYRPGLVESVRTASGRAATKSISTSVVRTIPEEKPLASGNGINVGISLAEPVLFLQGFEQTETSERSTAMLRGSLHLRVSKPAKVKAITLKFRGKATTKWPEGTIPRLIYGL